MCPFSLPPPPAMWPINCAAKDIPLFYSYMHLPSVSENEIKRFIMQSQTQRYLVSEWLCPNKFRKAMSRPATL